MPQDDDFEQTLNATAPIVARDLRSQLKRPSLPEAGRISPRRDGAGAGQEIGDRHAGTGQPSHLHYTPDEMEFLTTTAHQLGLAVENLRLVEQILRSHRQWTNTFDSIHDLVLLHDSDFRVMKANHALLER